MQFPIHSNHRAREYEEAPSEIASIPDILFLTSFVQECPISPCSLALSPIALFLCLLTQRNEDPKVPGGSLNLQFHGIGVVCPGKSISPSRIKITRPAEHEVVGTRSKYFASRSLGVMVRVPLPFPTLDSWMHESWLWDKQHHPLDVDLEQAQPSGEPCPSPAGIVT